MCSFLEHFDIEVLNRKTLTIEYLKKINDYNVSEQIKQVVQESTRRIQIYRNMRYEMPKLANLSKLVG